jgi:hypothetical protein
MNSEDTSPAISVFTLVKNLAEASVFLGAGLFLIGWSYLYGYYRDFGISADSLELSVNSVLVHSIPVIVRFAFWGTAIAVTTLLLILGSIRFTDRVFSRPPFVLLLVVVAGLVASRYARQVGRENAWQDAHLSTSTLPFVILQGAEEDHGPGCSLDEVNYRLLFRSNSQVYVVIPVDDTQNRSAPSIRVCNFPESRIQAMRIQVGLEKR